MHREFLYKALVNIENETTLTPQDLPTHLRYIKPKIPQKSNKTKLKLILPGI